ncbi:Cytochrome P450 3A31 [Toxocara canis]|uniref:Cytochrome P450 3A31 n=1 Tax=Toxocara canis TaxID=6265 RepID=A0A0B2UWA3_TOXCA|nr:Cytochrome P450 3A31 [Toxocara canis]
MNQLCTSIRLSKRRETLKYHYIYFRGMHLGAGEYVALLLAAFAAIFCYLPLTAAVIIILTITSAIFWKLYRLNNYWLKQGIPGPKPNLIFGNLLQLKNGFKTFDIENTKKYGSRFAVVFAGVPVFVTSDLDLLREVLVKQFNCFANREIRNITYNENHVGSKMMLVLKDQLWKDVRRTVTPAFSSAKMKNMMPLLEGCIVDLLNKCDLVIDESNGEFEAKELCGNYTMDAIAKCAFGVNAGSQRGDSPFANYARQILGFTFWDPRLLFITLFPNVARYIENFTGHYVLNHEAQKYVVDAVRKVIKERRMNPETGKVDFLKLLLDCSGKGDAETEVDCEITNDVVSKGGRKVELSDDLIISQCFIFLVAGYETSSATLQFCLYNLAVNPTVQEKGYEEVISVVGEKEYIDYDDLTNMPYIDQIIKETLRLFPPIPGISRQCKENVIIDGIKFERGCNVNAATFAIHYNEDFYPEAEEFRPERFSLEERKTMDPLTFIPFGFGPRNCIGMRFAQLEMRLALAYLLKHFRFTTNDKTPERKTMDPLTFIPFGFGPRNCIGMRFAQLEMRLALAYLLKHFRFTTNDKTPKPPLQITVLPFTKPAVPIYLTAIRRSRGVIRRSSGTPL